MTVDQIAALPVAELADPAGAHLWLWCINSMVEEAHQVARAWGFTPVTLLTWCKIGQPGVGHYLRNNTEHAILATVGKPMTPKNKPMKTWWEWPRGRHSVKPAGFYDLVEQVSPAPRLELFARQQRLGWESWGAGFEQSAASGSTVGERGEVVA
jgi:N6-adenosine-specific RNA methylase IME4